jgi:hypothetical protein
MNNRFFIQNMKNEETTTTKSQWQHKLKYTTYN